MSKVNCVTCAVWVPKGAAREDPEKVEITKEELARIIDETKENVEELEEINEDKYEQIEVEALEEDLLKSKPEKKKKKKERKEINGENEVKIEVENGATGGAEEDIVKQYNFDTYDDEKDAIDTMHKLGRLIIHADNDDDPLITEKAEDEDEEEENHKVLSSDNLVAVGHVDGDAAILEIYVYNSTEASFYVHHDILLPSIPLCTEWLNTDPGDEDLAPANMVAIGTMSPVIEVWDLDLVDALEPAYRLGRAGKKKKKLSGVGHKDAVLCLSWNKDMEHILASGSVDETVILWDLHTCTVAQKMTQFNEKVQALQWHPKESHCLLTGACDKKIRMFDCRSEDTYKHWKLDGEIESLTWDTTCTQPFHCLASTDQGSIYCIDARNDKPLWNIKAHQLACTGISLSPKCPGCLISTSEDKTVKVWDIAGSKPQLIIEKDPGLGVIHCVSPCVDESFVFCFGGDNRENNFKVMDLRQYKKVRTTFCERVGLPLDEDVEDKSEDEDAWMDEDGDSSDFSDDDQTEDSQMLKNKLMDLDDNIDDNDGEGDGKGLKKGKKKKKKQEATYVKPAVTKKKRKKKGGHLDNKKS